MKHPVSSSIRTGLVVGALLLASCGVPRVDYPYIGTEGVVTLTNLHPPAGRRRTLYSTNYQQDDLLPVCTPVVITVVSTRKMFFTVTETGEEYSYVFEPDRMGEDVTTHLNRYFGTNCEREAIDRMSEVDQRGIRDGRVYQGMTREATVIALGYPPLGQTDLGSDIWKYWNSRWDEFEVIFVNGVVQYVRQ